MAPTKKQKKGSMTIPQLRTAFDHIENFTTSLLRKERDAGKRRKAFQEEWMKVFHRAVDEKSADAYLHFESKKSKHAGKTRKMRGGAALGGAPLDYSTRPGIYGVYGTFPEYISAGFSTFGDATNKMAIQEGCNSAAEAAKFQAPYTGFGAASLAAQKGGKTKKRGKKTRKSRKQRGGSSAATGQRGGSSWPSWGEFASAASFRPLTSSAPPSQLYQNMMEWKGSEAYPSSLPNTGNPPYQGLRPMVQAPTAGVITRDLAAEI
jgi:hypothetical protein